MMATLPLRPGSPRAGSKPSSPKKPIAITTTMIDLVAYAIAREDGADIRLDPSRYRRLALAALKPLAKPTETMIDAAHEAVWSDNFWAINSRRDFKKAVRAMILAALKDGGSDTR
jgi:hypothetical protein